MDKLNYETLRVRWEQPVCFVQIYRPDAGNTINDALIEELNDVLRRASCADTTVVVLEGLPEVFCFGADFNSIRVKSAGDSGNVSDPSRMYEVCHQLATGDFISLCHLRGKVNAGGVGFASACDIVVADEQVTFSLSELLFGLIPAIILPFVIRRTGFQRANYLATSTKTIGAAQASGWGLVDCVEKNSAMALNAHLVRVRRLSKKAIRRYKNYARVFNGLSDEVRGVSLDTNRLVFSDPENIAAIVRYVEEGVFPWES